MSAQCFQPLLPAPAAPAQKQVEIKHVYCYVVQITAREGQQILVAQLLVLGNVTRKPKPDIHFWALCDLDLLGLVGKISRFDWRVKRPCW